ncbi:MAG: CAP domain-containing protein [Cyanobacteria bacterium P01_A01_bin.40]
MPQPSAYEQYLLELINRARLNPLAEANLWNIDLNDGLAAGTISEAAKQPLAFNLLLIDASRSHSQWMLDTDTFSHTGEGGSSPGDRIRDAGYQFTGSWTWGENIGYTGTTGTLNVNNAVASVNEGLFKSSGHRKNILNNNFREIGLATLTGDYKGYNSLMVTEKFARSGSNVFLTGVAFDDLVLDDDFYTVGEGLDGLKVKAVRQSDNRSFTTTTMASGGYQMALEAGTYNISFSDNNQTIGNTRQITIAGENIKLDLDTSNLMVEMTQQMGEIGQISNLNYVNQTIQLNNSYVNPVVFALTLSHNGGDPAIARITDIQDDSFSLYLQEAEYLDGKHKSESLSYIVLEAGTWELADGTLLEVGTLDTNAITTSSWSNINFESDFATKPAIFSQVQTQNGGQFVRTRQNSSSVDGFALAMEEEEHLKASGHARETVGWLAIETGSGEWDGLEYQAGNTGTRIDHTWDKINFKQSFDQAPNFFASVASFRGGDPIGLRHQNLGSSSVQIELEEDQSLDSELGHTLESVNFLAIAGSGNLSAVPYDPMTNF